MIPEDLHYTDKHEWVSPPQASNTVRIGITDYAQDSLGDIVYVQLPDPGTSVEAGQPLGELESTKSASEIYSPVSGTVAARNDQLSEKPELINSDPYGAGWMVEIELADSGMLDELLDSTEYQALTESG